MLTLDESINTAQILNILLVRLQGGHCRLIEYRTDAWPGAAGCHLRIRWQETAGGLQFGLRTVNSLGQEGSGYYTPDQFEMAVAAMREVERFHAPSPFRARLDALRKHPGPAPKWHWVEAQEPSIDLRQELFDKPMVEGMVTINLEAPNADVQQK